MIEWDVNLISTSTPTPPSLLPTAISVIPTNPTNTNHLNLGKLNTWKTENSTINFIICHFFCNANWTLSAARHIWNLFFARKLFDVGDLIEANIVSERTLLPSTLLQFHDLMTNWLMLFLILASVVSKMKNGQRKLRWWNPIHLIKLCVVVLMMKMMKKRKITTTTSDEPLSCLKTTVVLYCTCYYVENQIKSFNLQSFLMHAYLYCFRMNYELYILRK